MRKQGFATYIALTLLMLLIGLVFMATVAGNYAANVVSSTLARTKEAKILAQIHNADALRSLVYFDYRTTSLDSQTTPGAASVPGGKDALTYLCQNKPSYLAYSWFYEPRMRPPSAQAGLSDCPFLLVNDYVGQALSTPPPPTLRSTYSIYYSTTALITAIAPHLSNGGPPLLEYAFTPVLVKSVWSNPDPYYLFPFSPDITPQLSEGSIIDVPGILSPFRSSDEFGVFRADMGKDTSQPPATFIAPIGMPDIRTPAPPSTFTSLNCSTTGPSAPRCDSLGYAYNPTSLTTSLSLPFLYWTARSGSPSIPNQVLLPPLIYFGLNQVSLTNKSAPQNPFVGGFSYFAAPLQRETDYRTALTNAIYSTYTGLRADQSFSPFQDFNLYLGVDQNHNQVVRVDNFNSVVYEEHFPPEGPYTTRVLYFHGGYMRMLHIKRLPGSPFAMNGRVNLDLVIRAGNGRSIVLWDDLTMENGSCDSAPTWQQGVPIPASCPRKQLMLLHLVSNHPIYFSAVKNWVLNGVVVAMTGNAGFNYLPGTPYTTTKTDIHMVGAWFGGQPVMSGTYYTLPRFFLTAPELDRSERIWPKLPYPLHINALQVLGDNFFSQ